MKYTLVCRDSATALEALPEHSVRAIMQDPPAGMDLMGLDWERLQGLDFAKDLARVFAQERRVLKPGHWSLTWAHPKTSHWTAVALELSGFEVVTKIVHLNPEAKSPAPGKLLAPGHEEWILARAPGPPQPLNIGMWQVERHPRTVVIGNGYDKALDRVIGTRKSGTFTGKRNSDKHRNTFGKFKGTPAAETPREGSTGGVSRYFPREDDLFMVYAPRARMRHRELYPGGPESVHPTKKSLRLIVPLLDLITGALPAGTEGPVVDAYLGSGTTAAACAMLGLDFWGADRNEAYVREAEASLSYWVAETPHES